MKEKLIGKKEFLMEKKDILAKKIAEKLPGKKERTGEKMKVIYQTAEDGLGDTIKPRLLSAEADCNNILVIDDSDKALTVSDERLEEAVRQTNAKLIVLDPLQGYLGAEVDMHRANEIRPLMHRLSTLADKYKCAVVLIGHMNKSSVGKSNYRGLGSIDIHAAARSVVVCGRVKDEPEIRVLCQIKSSLAPERTPIAFRLSEEKGFEWIDQNLILPSWRFLVAVLTSSSLRRIFAILLSSIESFRATVT